MVKVKYEGTGQGYDWTYEYDGDYVTISYNDHQSIRMPKYDAYKLLSQWNRLASDIE